MPRRRRDDAAARGPREDRRRPDRGEDKPRLALLYALRYEQTGNVEGLKLRWPSTAWRRTG